MRWLFWLSLLLVGCGQPAGPRSLPTVTTTPVPGVSEPARIKVDRAGRLFLNGKPVSLDELKQELARLRQAGGTVRFFHDNPGGENHPQAVEALQAIAAAKVSLRMQNTDFD
jgi:biopolymer transport protein ExbD